MRGASVAVADATGIGLMRGASRVFLDRGDGRAEGQVASLGGSGGRPTTSGPSTLWREKSSWRSRRPS
jgi:hypothetical protein